jgi:hypothetical protein
MSQKPLNGHIVQLRTALPLACSFPGSPLTSAGPAHGHVVGGLSALALGADVHRAVPVYVQAISYHRALLRTESQTIGEETFPVFSYNHIYFYWLSPKKEKEEVVVNSCMAGRGRKVLGSG